MTIEDLRKRVASTTDKDPLAKLMERCLIIIEVYSHHVLIITTMVNNWNGKRRQL
jgi:hypothetical protein